MIFPIAEGMSSTIFINTIATGELNEITFRERLRIISMENGVMESLFDAGHVFFNTYSSVNSSSIINEAKFQGADYYIMLKPDSFGIKWEFYSFIEPEKTLQGYREMSAVQEGEIEQWTRLGGSLIKELLKHFKN